MAATVITRILLRVLAGILIGWGAKDVADLVTTDPDILTIASQAVEVAAGLAVWAVGEVWYFLAKRFGWRT